MSVAEVARLATFLPGASLPQVRRAVCLAAGDPDEQWWPTLRFVSRVARDDVEAERRADGY
ncbi:MAG: hypothetical protein VX938_13670, partial [Myxococcota bacterium]|nr:hypothetical protein [Myxococcota bacterium]